MSVHYWLLGMLHLHEEEFQAFAGCVLIGREEVKPIIWPPGYVTTSSRAEVGVVLQAGSMRTQSKEGTVLTPSWLGMRFSCFGRFSASCSELAPLVAGFPAPPCAK